MADVWRAGSQFATAGSVVDLWSADRHEPLHTFKWGDDSLTGVKFNPVEARHGLMDDAMPCVDAMRGDNGGQVNLLASTCHDRNICLYDIRGATPLRKVRSCASIRTDLSSHRAGGAADAVQCRVLEPDGGLPLHRCQRGATLRRLSRTHASQDGNLYTFDLRKLDKALNVHMDFTSAGRLHVCLALCSAAMDVDYSPTGLEFVAGGFDQSLRIFKAAEGRSRSAARDHGGALSRHGTAARCTTPSACSASSASSGRPMPSSCSPAATRRISGESRTSRLQ